MIPRLQTTTFACSGVEYGCHKSKPVPKPDFVVFRELSIWMALFRSGCPSPANPRGRRVSHSKVDVSFTRS
ncbi:hypothetical protein KL929_002668 [Ogataea haglerorum]|uniref:Uncharacterized protein n=1 Tax=Ogataea haglerorum TaxID=1937702 RepID=A0ABQ7RFM6_9ASCO|nr:uncharacterized protein KL911_004656 [Ogataea haglerorum]KAG7691492.1 hypothetical protein KL915_005239 [Ogataea haglerorum]KAG7698373.1 hypothetical protein KL951_001637 [Ogataea haglerorum]KAG7708133.1 hypothetical protein KL950_002759 [Ogataea haglerorum]KAG7713114.1 hypothetical protein KL913_005341 [Ogataea haglerorum]KAG7719545.1 hypothetical protein KL949_002537 [Ogataea haglerorum]